MRKQLTKPLAKFLLVVAATVPLCKATSVDVYAGPGNTGPFTFSNSQTNGNVVAEPTGQHTATSTQYDTLSTGTSDYANVFETTVTTGSTGITVTLSSTADLNNVSLPLTGTSSSNFVVLANGTVILNGNSGLETGEGVFATSNTLQASYVPVIYTRFAPVAAPPPILQVPAAVPEPGTYFITGLGLALFGAATRVLRRRR